MGYEDIFNENEINEIKDLYDKAQAELQESIASPEVVESKTSAILNQTTVKQDDAEDSEEVVEVKLEEVLKLRSHFDIVRAVHVSGDEKILATVSEDCMVKLWNLTNLEQSNSDTRGNVEPYLTLRGHTGALLAATGRDDLLFTAGIEGVIKMWTLPPVSEVNQYGDTFEGHNYC